MVDFKVFLSLEKEEKWLTEKAQRGLQLKKKGLFYHFDDAKSRDEASVQIDIRYFSTREDYQEYLAMFADFGWEHLAGSYRSGLHYFLSDEGKDKTIFNDQLSKGIRYLRLAESYALVWMMFFVLTLALVSNGTMDFGIFLHPRELFLTPDIWILEGWSQVRAILFEIPFVLIRLFYTYAMVILSVILGYIAFRYYKWYQTYAKKSTNQ